MEFTQERQDECLVLRNIENIQSIALIMSNNEINEIIICHQWISINYSSYTFCCSGCRFFCQWELLCAHPFVPLRCPIDLRLQQLPWFLGLQGVSGSSWTFLAPDLSAAIPPESLFPLKKKWCTESTIWMLKITPRLLLLLGLFQGIQQVYVSLFFQ